MSRGKLFFKANVISRFFELTGNSSVRLTTLGVLSLGILITDFILPWFLKDIVTLLFAKDALKSSSIYILLGLGIVRLILTLWQGKISGVYIAQVISRLNERMAARCVDSRAAFSSKSATQVISLYSEALFVVEQFLDSVLWQTWIHLFYCLGAVSIAFYLGGAVVAFAFIPFALALLLGKKLRSRIEGGLETLQSQRGKMADVFEDLIEGRSVILANQAREEAIRRFSTIEQSAFQNRKSSLILLNFYQPLFEGVALFAFIVIGLVGYQITQRYPGDISRSITTTLYLIFLARSLLGVAPLLPMWDRFKVAVGQIENLFDLPVSVNTERPVQKSPQGGILIQNMTFGYDSTRKLFQDSSFQFEGAKRTAICGPNGIGKSTLLKIIVGELQPQKGGVSLGNSTDKARIAYLPQEPFLFRMSVWDNLCLIDPNVSKEEVWRLAAELGLEAFLNRLSDGLDHEVGGRGLSLSGGERQKISLLRFALRSKRSELCLLDEPTSYIDLESEEALMLVLLKQCLGKTTLIVSHRPWLAEKCDRVITLGGA